jgi:hypothetical protein
VPAAQHLDQGGDRGRADRCQGRARLADHGALGVVGGGEDGGHGLLGQRPQRSRPLQRALARSGFGVAERRDKGRDRLATEGGELLWRPVGGASAALGERVHAAQLALERALLAAQDREHGQGEEEQHQRELEGQVQGAPSPTRWGGLLLAAP